MEQDFVNGNLGAVGKYDLSFKAGALVFEIDASAGPASSSLIVKVDAGQVLDALAKAIPGKFDDVLIAELKAILLA